MSNLLKETESVLQSNGKTMKDIIWIGTNDVEIPVAVFKELADKEYDAGFGSPKVAIDLIICGSDWFMERHEYDGSEWWEFKKIPVRPERKIVPKVIVDDSFMWCTLEDMNNPNGDIPFDWEGMEAT